MLLSHFPSTAAVGIVPLAQRAVGILISVQITSGLGHLSS